MYVMVHPSTMSKSYHLTACFVSLLALQGLGAQVRTREIGKWNLGGAFTSITASSEGRIELAAIQGADRLLLYIDPDEVKKWADSAEKVVTAVVTPSGSDKLEFQSPELEGSDESDVTLRRQVGGRGPGLYLFFSDKYVVNTVLVPLTEAQAEEFIGDMRKAVAAVKEIRR
jgi:hypothetical protein